MINKLTLFMIFSMLATTSQANTQEKQSHTFTYIAEIKELKNPKSPSWLIKTDSKIVEGVVQMEALFTLNDEKLIQESVKMNKENADLIEHKVQNLQLGDQGRIWVDGNKTKLSYTDNKGVEHNKTLSKKEKIVTSGNFDRFIEHNFEKLKNEKSLQFIFFVWDAKDTFNFTIKYKGPQKLGAQNTQYFTMNASSFILSSFLSDIEIWFSEDMTQAVQYKGRVAVKKKNPKNQDLEAFDALVTYQYK